MPTKPVFEKMTPKREILPSLPQKILATRAHISRMTMVKSAQAPAFTSFSMRKAPKKEVTMTAGEATYMTTFARSPTPASLRRCAR